jgi:uncharacterized Zn-binding protein involved in type VI secretion
MAKVRQLGTAGDAWEGQMEDGTRVTGVAISGSPNVRLNGRPVTRVGDAGIALTPQGPRLWRAVMGAATVRVNGRMLHRTGELTLMKGG